MVLSVFLHLWLVHVNPSLMIGGTLTFPEREAPSPPITLEDVQIEALQKELPTLLDRFAKERAESPSDWSLEEATPEVDTASLPVPEIEKVSTEVAQRDPTEVSADLPAPLDTWQPHQEILMITETRIQEEIAVLPRAFVAPVMRVPDAPHIVLPLDRPDATDLAIGPATFEPSDAGGQLGGTGTSPGGWPIGMAPPPETELLDAEASLIPELDLDPVEAMVALTEEADETVSEMEAVEDLLRLETVSYIDPADPEYRYFQIQIHRQGIERLPVLPREVVILQDCSESMTTSKLKQCIRGLYGVIDSLSVNDTFNIITFRESVETCFEKSESADVVRKARGKGFLAELKAFGKTDVYASLQQMAQLKSQTSRPIIALLVTDGRPTMGLTDSSEIIESFTQDNEKRVAVFTVGGGKRANKYLLDFLSFRNRGDSLVVPLKEDIPSALNEIARQLQRPVLMDLNYRVTSSDQVEIYPRTLTHLYLDRPLVLKGRVPADVTEFAVQIEGTSGDGRHDMVFRIEPQNAEGGTSELRQSWAWQSILDRVGRYIASQDPDEQAKIEELSRRYNILVPYAYSLDAVLPR